jgi:hypothetical protein
MQRRCEVRYSSSLAQPARRQPTLISSLLQTWPLARQPSLLLLCTWKRQRCSTLAGVLGGARKLGGVSQFEVAVLAARLQVPNTSLSTRQGSMFCWSEASCQERNLTLPWFTSSTRWTASFAQGGIFDPDPTASSFALANKIYVKVRPWSFSCVVADALVISVLQQRLVVWRRRCERCHVGVCL